MLDADKNNYKILKKEAKFHGYKVESTLLIVDKAAKDHVFVKVKCKKDDFYISETACSSSINNAKYMASKILLKKLKNYLESGVEEIHETPWECLLAWLIKYRINYKSIVNWNDDKNSNQNKKVKCIIEIWGKIYESAYYTSLTLALNDVSNQINNETHIYTSPTLVDKNGLNKGKSYCTNLEIYLSNHLCGNINIKPVYEYSTVKDENGKTLHKYRCSVGKLYVCHDEFYKKTAKQHAALQMIHKLMELKNNRQMIEWKDIEKVNDSDIVNINKEKTCKNEKKSSSSTYKIFLQIKNNELYAEMVKKINKIGDAITSTIFNHDITHLVIDDNDENCSIEYAGYLIGAYVIKTKWILDSFKAKKWMNITSNYRALENLPPIHEKIRSEKALLGEVYYSNIFQNKKFYVSKRLNENIIFNIKLILLLGNGKLLTYASSQAVNVGPKEEKLKKKFKTMLNWISTEWVYNSIRENKMLAITSKFILDKTEPIDDDDDDKKNRKENRKTKKRKSESQEYINEKKKKKLIVLED